MDIFDILGPIMVGPSSPHTAGAARIGGMARALLGAVPPAAVRRRSARHRPWRPVRWWPCAVAMRGRSVTRWPSR